MAGVLTTGSTVSCANSGQANLSSSAKLKVSGNAVLLQSDYSQWSISGCTQTDASSSQVPCASILSLTAGAAGKLTAGGIAVELDSLAGQTNGKPVSTLSATAGQSKLTAV